MIKYLTFICFIGQITFVLGQESGNSFEKPSDAIFITGFEFGFVEPSASNFTSGLMLKTCGEYRFHKCNSPFIRLNIDTYDVDYSFSDNENNRLNGKTQFVDFIIGPGYRYGKNKTKLISTLQTGLSIFTYPERQNDASSFVINEVYMSSWVTRITVGVEYYFDPRLAVSLEFFYNAHHNKSPAWDDTINITGLTIGFSSVIF